MPALSVPPHRRRAVAALGAVALAVTALHWSVLAALHASAVRAPAEVVRAAEGAPRGPGAVRVVAAPRLAQAAPARPPSAADAAPRRARRTPAPRLSEPAVDAAAARRDDAWPTYATRVPPAFSRRYRVQRGAAYAGHGVFDWQPGDGGYVARFSTELGAQSFAWESRGAFDAAGLAPQRYVDRRARRGAHAANFLRDAARIAYSGPAVEHPLPPGAQDRLSWLVQLAAIVQARAALPAAGETLTLYVSGARGDADRWDFVVDGVEPVATPDGARDALRLTREPRRRWDVRVEVWLDVAAQHLPVRVLTTPTGAALPMDWLLDDAP
jgi:hypothetical protein